MNHRQSLLKRLKDFLTYKPPAANKFILPEASDEMSVRTQKADGAYGDGQIPIEPLQKSNVASKQRRRLSVKKPIKLGQYGKDQQKFSKGEQLKQEYTADVIDQESPISPDILINLTFVEKEMNAPVNKDVVIRRFKVGRVIDAFIVFIEGMIDRKVVNESILKPLMTPGVMEENIDPTLRLQYINDNIITTDETRFLHTLRDIFAHVLSGATVLLVDGCGQGLAIGSQGFETRAIDRPQTENVVRGSQEGFTENLRTNITMLRRIIRNRDLITEMFTIGNTNQNRVAIIYLQGIANPAVINEVKRRILSIQTDFIFGAGAIQQFIEDQPFMLAPQALTSERPDRTASHIMEGKVAILSDGEPFSLVVPITFDALFHSPEDGYVRWQFASFARIIRLIGFLVAALLPSLYLALVTHHHQTIPTDLLFAIARAREQVPFPTIVEVLLMEVSFELIREASIRVPGVTGTTLGIVGALILGQAAVAAKIVSPILIIVVAVTGLGSFAITSYELGFGVRILRFFFIFLASVLGFFGISVGLLIVSSLAVSMKSFGVPFFATWWPRTSARFDSVIRKPIWNQEERPDYLQPLNKRRQPKISRGWVRDNPPEGNRE